MCPWRRFLGLHSVSWWLFAMSRPTSHEKHNACDKSTYHNGRAASPWISGTSSSPNVFIRVCPQNVRLGRGSRWDHRGVWLFDKCPPCRYGPDISAADSMIYGVAILTAGRTGWGCQSKSKDASRRAMCRWTSTTITEADDLRCYSVNTRERWNLWINEYITEYDIVINQVRWVDTYIYLKYW